MDLKRKKKKDGKGNKNEEMLMKSKLHRKRRTNDKQEKAFEGTDVEETETKQLLDAQKREQDGLRNLKKIHE